MLLKKYVGQASSLPNTQFGQMRKLQMYKLGRLEACPTLATTSDHDSFSSLLWYREV